ncbi:MAG TPA: ABC transporter ATP-binding protein [Candidatus Saccharimonadales bacterium]|nr:ABC transporter ATP-binding protein [Candidatus Saccharimonadales bacterium]
MADTSRSVRLDARGVSAGYGQSPIVEGIDVDIAASEVVAIIGPNGAGKSTFLKAIVGITRMFGGSIMLDGREIARLSTDEVARRGVGYVPQGNAVFPSLTVRENLELGAYQKPKETAARMAEVLALLPELAEKLPRRSGVMSGGERTMLGIGRALMAKPTLLLLDEPSSGLAPRVVSTLWEYLERLRAAGIPMLIVEQRTQDILQIAERGYVFVNGRVALEARADTLLNDVDLAALFLQAGGSAAPSVEPDPPLPTSGPAAATTDSDPKQ